MMHVAATPIVGPELVQLKDWLGRRHSFVRVLNTAIAREKVQMAEEQISGGDEARMCPGASAAFKETMKLVAALEVLEEYAAGKRPLESGSVIT